MIIMKIELVLDRVINSYQKIHTIVINGLNLRAKVDVVYVLKNLSLKMKSKNEIRK